MAIAFVQYDDFYNALGGGTIANDVPLNTTSGNLLVVVINSFSLLPNGAIVTGVVDTEGNTYTKAIGEYRSGNTSLRCEIWYAANITGNANNVTTATFTSTSVTRYISVSEFSGAAVSSPLDDTSFNSETNKTAHDSGNATATVPGSLIIGGYNGQRVENITVGSGFTALSSDLTSVYNLAQYDILGAAGDYSSDCTTGTTNASINICAIFKVFEAKTKTFTADAILKASGLTKTFSADAILYKPLVRYKLDVELRDPRITAELRKNTLDVKTRKNSLDVETRKNNIVVKTRKNSVEVQI